ncbi:hypothetical protein SEA_THUMB_58 [Mycobacterium phage Thumb]|uniref:Uncharacterized protein n=1 Tax=Mycobacterium phage Konstantine TaxID=563121 RepID=B5U531_9CAUD|nr:gp61 [Mycobacterium phage Konstantine]ACI12477.1 hypothetical protein KONSTANTINE_61 [Mycobacterium phage Konstantine]AVO26035.1 hypothetical protein SEA_THUMB_58 [Mycobacterium phage Thumb]AXH47219.1 hypothetical protein SEA_CBORCH11_59 [Mycobacterium phage Cborch11]
MSRVRIRVLLGAVAIGAGIVASVIYPASADASVGFTDGRGQKWQLE